MIVAAFIAGALAVMALQLVWFLVKTISSWFWALIFAMMGP